MTWWKQAAKHWLAPVAVLVVVGGCGGETPTATALPPVPVKPAPLPETSPPPAPPIGLTPLPSAEEVHLAAPGGRADPFAPLVNVEAEDAQDPTTGVALTGVLLVGDQKRAIVTTSNGTGVICVGADGRCGADAPLLLPTGWSVLSIDVARGCIRFALNDEPQDPFCIA
ncbi:hypothetical protein [Synechococcus sp. N32]|uniref:hypothetical protein n=1 Tax=Synechococcus sp. N32 TaxID=2575514 RepID=UPI000E0FDD27|nr:hypothetical protein [Synechococcus sp. N32]